MVFSVVEKVAFLELSPNHRQDDNIWGCACCGEEQLLANLGGVGEAASFLIIPPLQSSKFSLTTSGKIQSNLCVHGFHIWSFNHVLTGNIWEKTVSVLNMNRLFLVIIPWRIQHNKYSRSICTAFGIISHPEMIWSLLENMGRFCVNTTELWHVSIHRSPSAGTLQSIALG
jgi:hypothetical protein